MKILHDIEFYSNDLENKKYDLVLFIYSKGFGVEINPNNYHDLPRPIKRYKKLPKNIIKIRNNTILSHKIRVCEYYVEKRKETIRISRDMVGWKDHELWGGYNRAIEIDHNDVERQYINLIRSNKLKRILNEKKDLRRKQP